MTNVLGKEWHLTPGGSDFLDYFTAPSTILYGVFKDLISAGAATSVYHMSGGAYNGKLAKPLAKHGLFVRMTNLFAPEKRELRFLELAHTTSQTAYGKFPMGNDGFVTIRGDEKALDIIGSHGLEGRRVGRLEQASDGRTGVELVAWNNEKVYFSGKD